MENPSKNELRDVCLYIYGFYQEFKMQLWTADSKRSHREKQISIFAHIRVQPVSFLLCSRSHVFLLFFIFVSAKTMLHRLPRCGETTSKTFYHSLGLTATWASLLDKQTVLVCFRLLMTVGQFYTILHQGNDIFFVFIKNKAFKWMIIFITGIY